MLFQIKSKRTFVSTESCLCSIQFYSNPLYPHPYNRNFFQEICSWALTVIGYGTLRSIQSFQMLVDSPDVVESQFNFVQTVEKPPTNQRIHSKLVIHIKNA